MAYHLLWSPFYLLIASELPEATTCMLLVYTGSFFRMRAIGSQYLDRDKPSMNQQIMPMSVIDNHQQSRHAWTKFLTAENRL